MSTANCSASSSEMRVRTPDTRSDIGLTFPTHRVHALPTGLLTEDAVDRSSGLCSWRIHPRPQHRPSETERATELLLDEAGDLTVRAGRRLPCRDEHHAVGGRTPQDRFEMRGYGWGQSSDPPLGVFLVAVH